MYVMYKYGDAYFTSKCRAVKFRLSPHTATIIILFMSVSVRLLTDLGMLCLYVYRR